MPRKELSLFDNDLNFKDAQRLTQKIFGLQEKLGIKYPQMAEDSGLTVEQLYRLRCTWVTGRAAQPKKMLKKFANGLILFWNENLETQPVVTGRKRTIKLSPERIQIFKILIEENGVKKARKMLAKRRKAKFFDQYLQGLTIEILLELFTTDPDTIFSILLYRIGKKGTAKLLEAAQYESCLRTLSSNQLADLA